MRWFQIGAANIINKGEPPSFKEELAQDVIEISLCLYGNAEMLKKRKDEDVTGS